MDDTITMRYFFAIYGRKREKIKPSLGNQQNRIESRIESTQTSTNNNTNLATKLRCRSGLGVLGKLEPLYKQRSRHIYKNEYKSLRSLQDTFRACKTQKALLRQISKKTKKKNEKNYFQNGGVFHPHSTHSRLLACTTR